MNHNSAEPFEFWNLTFLLVLQGQFQKAVLNHLMQIFICLTVKSSLLEGWPRVGEPTGHDLAI